MIVTRAKLCFFNSHKSWGGGEKWHLDVATRLSVRGWRIVLATNRGSELDKKAARTVLRRKRVKVGNASFVNPFKLVLLVLWLRKENFETIILNLPADLKLAGLAAKLAGVSRIIYRRGSAIPIRNSLLNRFLFRYVVTDIIANSEETKRTILSRNERLFPAEKIFVLYNGIDISALSACLPSVPEYKDPTGIVLGTAGRLSRQKNQIFLLKVAEELKNRGIKFKMLVAGCGPLEQELREAIIEKKLENHVEMCGFVDDVSVFMQSLDLFLLSSTWEGFGYVLVEAMAQGKPIIAFDSSSTPEIVRDGQDGFLVSPEDVTEFSQKIELLVLESEQRRQMGDNGRSHVVEKFTIETALDNLEHYLLSTKDVRS
jgi:glycosyltransferase involved in cell wall biosynthesis